MKESLRVLKETMLKNSSQDSYIDYVENFNIQFHVSGIEARSVLYFVGSYD